MNIYLFRHGEVENPAEVLYARLPGFHLSAEGREHVCLTAEKLRGAGIKKVYTSPLERGIETAEIIIEVLGLNKSDLIIEENLIESDCGKCAGMPYKKFYKMVERLDWAKQDLIEPIEHSGERVLSVMDRVALGDENAILVSHGDPIIGAVIKITGDWGFYANRYVRRGEFVKLSRTAQDWKVAEFSAEQ